MRDAVYFRPTEPLLALLPDHGHRRDRDGTVPARAQKSPRGRHSRLLPRLGSDARHLEDARLEIIPMNSRSGCNPGRVPLFSVRRRKRYPLLVA